MADYYTTNNEILSANQVKSRITTIKNKILNEAQFDGMWCRTCGLNKPVECSHIFSVKLCREYGLSEFAWLRENIKLECRDCHQITENQSRFVRFARMVEHLNPSYYPHLLSFVKSNPLMKGEAWLECFV